MKYIVDLDALKDCLDFLQDCKINGEPVAYLKNVKLLIDRFPKEEYVENAKVYRKCTDDVMKDIREGRGLRPLNKNE